MLNIYSMFWFDKCHLKQDFAISHQVEFNLNVFLLLIFFTYFDNFVSKQTCSKYMKT